MNTYHLSIAHVVMISCDLIDGMFSKSKKCTIEFQSTAAGYTGVISHVLTHLKQIAIK